MKLYEFFGNIDHNVNQDNDRDPAAPSKEDEKELGDQLFWYILDNNDLHKKYYMPAAKELHRIYKSDTKSDDVHDWKTWMPMVEAGCREFYKEHEVKESPQDAFNKELRIDLCKRLADHYHEEIVGKKDSQDK